MRKIILLLLFTFINLNAVVVDEMKSNVYFANGIATTQEQAFDARDEIETEFKAKYPDSYPQVIQWGLLYNETHGMGLDLYESMFQKVTEHALTAAIYIMADSLDYSFKGLYKMILKKASKKEVKEYSKKLSVELAKQYMKKISKDAKKKYTQKQLEMLFELILDELIDQVMDAYLDYTEEQISKMAMDDIQKQINEYNNAIQRGNGIIIVAHSQGNLFANYVDNPFQLSFNAWEQQFFHMIGVASPADHVLNGGPYITFDNDIIQLVPNSLAPNMYNPTRYYYEVTGTENIVDNPYSIEAHSFLESYMSYSHTKNIILSYIDSSIYTHIKTPSQWDLIAIGNKTCSTDGCQSKLKQTKHKYSNYYNNYFSELVYPFNEGDGKIYPTIDNKYVKADFGGIRVAEICNEEACYELKDTNNATIGIIDGCKECDDTPPTPISGYVEVSLSWANPDIDMDLSVNFPGSHDIKDKGCILFEHFYSPAVNYDKVGAGLYPVYITYEAPDNITSNKSLVEYQDIVVTIKVPGASETRTVNLKIIDSLNNGHIADIKVEENKVEVVLKDEFKTNSTVIYYQSDRGYSTNAGGGGGGGWSFGGVSYSGSYGAGGGYSGSWTSNVTPNPYTNDYIYSIIWHISQAYLGTLAGADINIYNIKDYNLKINIGSNPIYTDKSSYGSSVYTAGIIAPPRDILDALRDDGLYIVEAKGGLDIDANDDKIVDNSPTANYGTIRVMMSGYELKTIGFKINILTEMAYQIAKSSYDENDLSKFYEKSDEAVKCLLKSDINVDGRVDTIDALYFVPYNDMNKMYRNYNNEFMPIINKVHNGQEIYQDSFNLYAKPLVKGGYFSLREDTARGTTIGKIGIDCVSESPIHSFRLTGAGAENFEVDINGNLKVSQSANIVYEAKRIYSLQVIGTNDYGDSPAENVYITVTADNSPIITSTLTSYAIENMSKGTVLGAITIDDMGFPLIGVRLEGDGAENFEVDDNGVVKVANGGGIDKNVGTYYLRAIAQNAFGDSAPSSVTLKVYDDIPVLSSLFIRIRDDIPIGTAIGKPTYYEGLSPIKEFHLSGIGAENFIVDNGGNIKIAQNALIDYKNSPYYLELVAINNSGESIPVAVTIEVLNGVGSLTLADFNTSIYVSLSNASKVGRIAYTYSLNPPTNFTISGSGSEIFEIDNIGNIKLIDVSGLSVGQTYSFDAFVSNNFGLNASAKVNIRIIDDKPALSNATFSVFEQSNNGTFVGKVGYSYGASPIVLFELESGETANFVIDNSGYIRVAENANINYSVKSTYTVIVKGTNSIGNSATSTITISVKNDTPTLNSLTITIFEGTGNGTAIGKVGYSYGVNPVTSFELIGDGAGDFVIDNAGIISTRIGADINYDIKQTYTLTVKGTNDIGKSGANTVTIKITDDAPVLKNGIFNIMENSYGGEYVGSVGVGTGGKSAITSFSLSGEGAEHFSIDKSGLIKVAIGAEIDYETRSVYHLKATAANSYDTSKEANITINVVNAPDEEPILIATTLSVDENSPTGTVVGYVGLYSHGADNITSFALSGTNSDWFDIDGKGKITVSGLANLDYETKKVFALKAKAVNSHGESNLVDVTINVNDLPDTPPSANGVAFRVNENSPAETFAGQININAAGSPIISTKLIGEGNENFKVYNNGTVVVANGANLDYETKKTYDLYVTVSNEFFTSDNIKVFIYINDLPDTPPVLNDTHFSIYNSTPADKTIGSIKVSSTIHCEIQGYVLSDNSVFGVRDNGQVYTKADISENNYTISVYALSGCGNSNSVNLTIDTKNRIISHIGAFDARDIALSSDETKAYIATYFGGLKIADVSDTKNPILINAGSNYNYYQSIALSSDETKAYVGTNVGLQIINVSNITNTVLLSSMIIGNTRNVVLFPNNTKVFASANGVEIIDVSLSSNPVLTNTINNTSRATNIVLSSDNAKLFATDYYSKNLEVINVSDPSNLTVIGSINNIGRASGGIKLSSDEIKVYAGIEYDLKIIDVSNTTDPTVIGSISIGNIDDVALSSDDTKVIVANSYSLKIVDVSNHTDPTIIGSIDNIGYVYRVVLSSDDTKAFVASNDGFRIIDIEDFINDDIAPITQDAIFSVDENSLGETFVGQLKIYNIDTDKSITLLGLGSEKFKAYNNGTIVVAEGANLDYEAINSYTLYATAYNEFGASNNASIKININNVPDLLPTVKSSTFYINENSPAGTFVGQLNIQTDGANVTSINITGGGAENFKAYNNGTVVVADGADLDYEKVTRYSLNIVVVSEVGASNTVTIGIYLNNLKDTLPVLQDGSYSIYKQTLANKTIGSVKITSTMHCDIEKFVLSDDSVFWVKNNGEIYTKIATSYKEYQLSVYAVSSCGNSDSVKLIINTNSEIAGEIGGIGGAYGIALSSNDTILFVSNDSGLKIIDISNTLNPTLIGSINIGYDSYGIALSSDNTKAFMTTSSNELKIIDVSDPTNPTLVGSISVGSAYGIALSSDNTKAFIVDYYNGLKIVDVSDPTNPTLIGSINNIGYAYRVVLSSDNTKAFMTTSSNGLKIIDVSDPINPTLIGSINNIGYNAYSIALSFDNIKAFTVDYSNGLKIVDVSNPTNPTLIGSINNIGYYNIALSSDNTKAFIVDYYNGLKIVDVSDPTNPTLIGSISVNSAYHIALSSDNTKAFVTTSSGLTIVDISKHTKVPTISTATFTINENSPKDTFVGQLEIYNNEAISSIILSGQGSESFKVYSNGTIVVADGANIDYETIRSYTLSAVAHNEFGASNNASIKINVNDLDDLPTIQSASFSVDENSAAETVVGNLIVSSPLTFVTSIVLSGTGSENFKVYSNGTVVVTEGANLDYEAKSNYSLKAVAHNIYGSSNIVDVIININDVADTPPVFADMTQYFNVDENSVSETVVGHLIINNILSPITSISLSGAGAEDFKVYNNGTIVVAEGAKLDYETQSYYGLSAIVDNEFGASNTGRIVIYIGDISDTPPVFLFTNYFGVYENSVAGIVMGELIIGNVLSPITSIELSGDGAENFKVYNNGTIVVAEGANIDYESNSVYSLFVVAHNEFGTSNSGYVIIFVEDMSEVPPIVKPLWPYWFNLDENLPSETYIAQVVIDSESELSDVYLAGDGHEHFNIALDGTITVANGAILDYETKQEYDLRIFAVNKYGTSKGEEIYIYLNNLPDSPPIVSDAIIYLDKNAQEGDDIGSLDIRSDGSGVDFVYLFGEGSENFDIAWSTSYWGEYYASIVISDTANIDSFEEGIHRIYAVASNEFGQSNNASIWLITGRGSEVSPPIFDNVTFVTFGKEIGEGEEIGEIYPSSNIHCEIDEYFTDDERFEMSGWGDSANIISLEPIPNGIVSNLTIYANSSCGESDRAVITIDTKNRLNSYELPMEYYNAGLAFVNNETQLFINTYEADSPYIIDLSNGGDNRYVDLMIEENMYLMPITISSKDGRYLYTVTYNYDANAKLNIYDISDNTNPAMVGSLSIERLEDYHVNMRMSKNNDKIFLQDSNAFYIIDIKNPSNPNMLDTIQLANHDNIFISKDEKIAYISRQYYADKNSVQRYDISVPNDIRKLSPITLMGINTIINISDDNTLLYGGGNGEYGLMTYDITDIDNPKLINLYNTRAVSFYPEYMSMAYLNNGKMFINDKAISPFMILDFSNPKKPNVSARVSSSSYYFYLSNHNPIVTQDRSKVFMSDENFLMMIDLDGFRD